MIRPRTCPGLFVLAAAFALAQTARAGYVTQTVDLDRSNTLADGVVYATVKVEAYDGVSAGGGGLKAGEVRLTYTADATVYDAIGPTFGLHTVGFNTDLALAKGQIVAPAGWTLTKTPNLSEFGKFSWKAATSNHTSPVLVLLVESLGLNATLDHFLAASKSASDNAVYFAAHIKDFKDRQDCDNVTSHWVGGRTVESTPPPPGGTGEPPPETPEPGALALCGAGIATLIAVRRRRGRLVPWPARG
jgi:hypothetical protein